MKIKYVARELPVEIRSALKVIEGMDKVVDLLSSLPGFTDFREVSGKYLVTLRYKRGRGVVECNIEADLKALQNGFKMEGIGDNCKLIVSLLLGQKDKHTIASIEAIYDGRNESTAKHLLDEIIDYITRYIRENAEKIREQEVTREKTKVFWSEYLLMKMVDKEGLTAKSDRLRATLLTNIGSSDMKLIKFSNNYSCEKVLNDVRAGYYKGEKTFYIVCMDRDYTMKFRLLVENGIITGIAAYVRGLWFVGEYATKIFIENLSKLNRVRVWVMKSGS